VALFPTSQTCEGKSGRRDKGTIIWISAGQRGIPLLRPCSKRVEADLFGGFHDRYEELVVEYFWRFYFSVETGTHVVALPIQFHAAAGTMTHVS
jgi:hypothetical protein